MAVVGPSPARTPRSSQAARLAGRLLAERGHDPAGHRDRAEASPGHTVVLPTGMSEMRNALVVLAVDSWDLPARR